MPALVSVRSSIIMDYRDFIRATILTNDFHDFSAKGQHPFVKLEGTKGAIHTNKGLLMYYAKAADDTFEYISK